MAGEITTIPQTYLSWRTEHNLPDTADNLERWKAAVLRPFIASGAVDLPESYDPGVSLRTGYQELYGDTGIAIYDSAGEAAEVAGAAADAAWEFGGDVIEGVGEAVGGVLSSAKWVVVGLAALAGLYLVTQLKG